MDTNDADILETFKAAALSVTRLYKTSAAAATKARSEGYQECLEDLLSFLEKNKPSAADATAVAAIAAVRHWASDRQDGRELPHNSTDSDDDTDKTADHPPSSPVVITRAPPTSLQQQSSANTITSASASTGNDVHMQTTEPSPVSVQTRPPATPVQPPAASGALPPFREPMAVPTRDAFTFQSTVPYPPAQQSGENYPNLADLELSDNQHHSGRTTSPAVLKGRMRASNDSRSRSAGRGAHVTRLAGQKRRIDFNELFDLQSIGKDGFPFGGGGKRARHN